MRSTVGDAKGMVNARRGTRDFVALAAVGLLFVSCGSTGSGYDAEVASNVALSGHRGDPATTAWTAWPQALHDAMHSGASPYVGPRSAHLSWERDLEGNVTPGPVVGGDGTIYAASNAGVLHAIDPGDGHDLWTVNEHGSYGVDQSTSPAVLPNGMVLWPGPHGNLVALTGDGKVLWRLAVGSQVTSPAVQSDGRVVVGNNSGLLLGLRPSPAGPNETWRLDLGEQSYGSPVTSEDGSTTYQTVLSGVVAVRGGSILWAWKVPTEIVEVSAAVAPSGTVVIGTNDPFQYGLDPADGSVLWRFRRDAYTYSSPGVTADGIAYFGDHKNRVIGLDTATGGVLFRHQGSVKDDGPGGIGMWTSVLVDSEHSTFVGTRQGLIYAVDRNSRRRWSYDAASTVDSYPALTADGTLLIGTTDGRLLAFADQ